LEQGSTLRKLTSDNGGTRTTWSWTPRNRCRAKDITSVIDAMVGYWPLTVRQVYYRLISSGLTRQPHWHQHGDVERPQVDIYKALVRTLKWMRIDNMLQWRAITDDHRSMTEKVGHSDPQAFVEDTLKWFLWGRYKKCLAQAQDNYIEVWIEKAALLHIVEPVADEFCRRVVCCRGYNSISFQADFYQRAKASKKIGQRPVVLYFGDWDPSGVDMLPAAKKTIEDELGLDGVDFYRCGINPEHFDSLQADPVPIKPKDPRAKKFVQLHGTTAYELDAFHPRDLQALVRASIAAFTDMEMIRELQAEEDIEQGDLDRIRAAVLQAIEETR
jgi:hypothetical protein